MPGGISEPDDDHDHGAPPRDVELRGKALESLRIEKGLVDPAALAAARNLTGAEELLARKRE